MKRLLDNYSLLANYQLRFHFRVDDYSTWTEFTALSSSHTTAPWWMAITFQQKKKFRKEQKTEKKHFHISRISVKTLKCQFESTTTFTQHFSVPNSVRKCWKCWELVGCVLKQISTGLNFDSTYLQLFNTLQQCWTICSNVWSPASTILRCCQRENVEARGMY